MARLIVRDALILTGDAAGTAFARGYLQVDGDRVSALGPGDPPSPTGTGSVLDAAGLIVVPGLVSCHGHAWLTAYRGLRDDDGLFAWAERNAPTLRRAGEREFRAGSELACFELARAGITTAVECVRHDPAIYAEAAARVGLRSLIGGMARGPSPDPLARPNWPSLVAETESAMERFAGNARARFFLGAHAPYTCPPEVLLEVRREAERLGLPLGIHLAETEREHDIVRERYGVSPTRYLADQGWLTPRTLAAHAVCLDPDDVATLARTGTAVAHCPVSNAKLASGIAPVPALRDAGVRVGLGTDSVLSNNRLDLFAEMRAAALLQRATTRDARVLTAPDVFAMATLDGARAIGWDDEIGSLEPGKQADLVLLDLAHPLGMTPARALSDVVWAAGPEHVVHVMVAGQWVVRDRVLANVDESARRAALALSLADTFVAP
jgi:5-methylthioadenosine/S-adenosylhomocysteine deaminase